MTRITVGLTDTELQALRELAQHERRDVRSQAAILIQRELERAGLLPADKFGGVEFHANTVNIYGDVVGCDQIGASAGQSTKSSFPQRRRLRLHWGYLLTTMMISALLFVGSLIVFPEWTRMNGWVFVLLVIVLDRALEAVANWRTAFDAPHDNGSAKAG